MQVFYNINSVDSALVSVFFIAGRTGKWMA
jgi:hypothetical protein